MKKKILIVEDEFAEANNLKLILQDSGYHVTGIARSVHQAMDLIRQTRPDLAVLDIGLQGSLSGIDLGQLLAPMDIPFIFLSANFTEELLEAAKATQPYGYLIKPYRTPDVLAAIGIAGYRHENNMETLLRQQSVLQTRLDIVVNSKGTQADKVLLIGKTLQSYFPFDYLGCEYYGGEGLLKKLFSFYRVGFDEYQRIEEKQLGMIAGSDLAGYQFSGGDAKSPSIVAGDPAGPAFRSLLSNIQVRVFDYLKMRSIFVLPLELEEGKWFRMYLASSRVGNFTGHHSQLGGRLKGAIADTLKGIFATGTVGPRQHLVKSGVGQEVAIQDKDFDGIVGKSPFLLNVFDQVKQVAPMDTSVLILGESGTGKEKIAECIHRLSGRSGGPFIKVNCAGFSPALIESELFGHEKGAFTGAIDRRTGKFELADKGTIFLDEIGEMPLESQVKILRVLQERQLERIGGQSPLDVDIRIIAATNRNLEAEVAASRFRLDLYYRLYVFPITLPPLRDRPEDIPLLVQHFIRQFNRKTGRSILGVGAEALAVLQQYPWPGNVRELEHFMERSLIMTRGDLLENITLAGVSSQAATKTPMAANGRPFKSYHEFERDYLIAVLEKCKGRLSGKLGAATILGLPVSTLNSKLIRLGIKKAK